MITLASLLLSTSLFAGSDQNRAYLEFGIRYTFWAPLQFTEFSGQVSADDHIPGSGKLSPYQIYDVDLQIDPGLYTTVKASARIADKWYVRALISDNGAWEELQDIAGAIGYDRLLLALETGNLNGNILFGSEHEDPRNFILETQSFHGRYQLGTVTWGLVGGDSAHLGVGLIRYQYPAERAIITDDTLSMEIDESTNLSLSGITFRGSDFEACVQDEFGCDTAVTLVVFGEGPLRFGVSPLEMNFIFGAAKEKASDAFAERHPELDATLDAQSLWGVGWSGDFSARGFLLLNRDRLRAAAYLGVQGREHILWFPGAGTLSLSESSSTDSMTKMYTSILANMFGGPTAGIAASF